MCSRSLTLQKIARLKQKTKNILKSIDKLADFIVERNEINEKMGIYK